MKIKTPAKINLYLKVTGKRLDGYHEIETLFLPIQSPFDQISITEIDASDAKIVISSFGESIPLDENNLCWKAAMEFAKFAEVKPSWNIEISKQIPVAAGMGGGSSDAAAVLKILARKYPLDNKIIFNIARSLGADVPFFLEPCPAVSRGIGDIITPVPDFSEIPLVILNPLFPVTAAWAYKNYIAHEKESAVDDVIEVLRTGNFDKLADVFCNDLQQAVFYKFPILGLFQDSLLNAGAKFAAMSGSGPTLFGVCSSAEAAAEISDEIKSQYNDAVYCIASSSCSSRQ